MMLYRLLQVCTAVSCIGFFLAFGLGIYLGLALAIPALVVAAGVISYIVEEL